MDIKIIGIDVDNVGKPRNDGTRGSALYRVPLKLSTRPSATWAELFPQVWDRPPEWTMQHRPGIGRVSGDTIVLDGTTVEEVRDVHLKTLKLVVAEVNRRAAEVEAKRQADRERKAAQDQAHEQSVREVAKDIRFED